MYNTKDKNIEEELIVRTAINLQTMATKLKQTTIEKRRLVLACMDILLADPDLFWEDFIIQLTEERKRFAEITADYYETDENKEAIQEAIAVPA